MRIFLFAFGTAFALSSWEAKGQMFQVDQESLSEAEGYTLPSASMVQSFTPTLPAIGFIEVKGRDWKVNDGSGGTLYVNLRQESYNGPIIATSSNLVYADNQYGWFRFLLSSNISIMPERIYFFEPLLRETNDHSVFFVSAYQSGYHRGMFFKDGVVFTANAITFREGIVIPQFNPTKWVNGKVELSWLGGGILEQSPNAAGPWNTVANSSSGSYTFAPIITERLFFRVRR